MPSLPHVDTQMAAQLALALGTLAVVVLSWWRARRRTPPPRPSPGAPNPWTVTPPPQQPATASPELSRLESLLRRTIPDPGARERLVTDAMQKTGGNREAAIRRVLDDVQRDNGRG